jgi:hypothetical protein
VVRTPEHQFLYFLVKKFGKLPDGSFYNNDPFSEDINPYLKIWLFESWLYECEKEAEKLKNQAILTGSFSNPEMAQKMIKNENPDFKATDGEATAEMLHRQIVEEEKSNGQKKKKKRKIIK